MPLNKPTERPSYRHIDSAGKHGQINQLKTNKQKQTNKQANKEKRKTASIKGRPA